MASHRQATSIKHRILVVDDHPIVRRGLRELVADEHDLELCGEADDVAQAVKQVETTRPDIVIVDLRLKSGHGLELIQKIKAIDKQIKVLVSSMHDESLFAERALRAGATGYINKQESPEKLIDAMRQVLRGEIYLSSRMATRLLRRITTGEPPGKDPIASLSDRELQVFEMIGQGSSTKQIARKTGLEPQDSRDSPRENQSKAEPQEQFRIEPPRHSVGIGKRVNHASRMRRRCFSPKTTKWFRTSPRVRPTQLSQ